VNFFPEKFGSPPEPDTKQVNQDYLGWFVEVDRLFFANGERALAPYSPYPLYQCIPLNKTGDPWREASVSSDFVTRTSTDMQPIYLSGAFHCSDMRTRSAVDPTVAKVQNAALGYMKTWLTGWPGTNS